MGEKTIAIRIDEELQKKIKFRLAEKGITLKDYIIGLVEEDLATQDDGPTKSELLAKLKAIKEITQEYLDYEESKKK